MNLAVAGISLILTRPALSVRSQIPSYALRSLGVSTGIIGSVPVSRREFLCSGLAAALANQSCSSSDSVFEAPPALIALGESNQQKVRPTAGPSGGIRL